MPVRAGSDALSNVYDLVRRISRRIGNRGYSLMFVGSLSLIISQSLGDADRLVRASPVYKALSEIMPLSAWAVMWGIVGVVCIIQAFMRVDRVAFALAAAAMWAWGLVYAYVWIKDDLPRGYYGAAIWIAFGGWLMLIANWPETVLVHEGSWQEESDEALDAIIVADGDGRIRSWNKAAESMFGWDFSEIRGLPLTALIPDRLRDQHEAGIARVRDSGKTRLAGRVLQVTAVRRDGAEIEVELTITSWHTKLGEQRFTGVLRHYRPSASGSGINLIPDLPDGEGPGP
jgi:PAS domain S-box-containing protein